MMRTVLVLVSAAAAFGCTTLGPMPGATGIAPIPATRAQGELQIAVVPGHYLSSGTQSNPKGTAIGQLLAALDPGQHLLPGLVLAGRVVGSNGNTYLEPVLGYRGELTDRFSAGVFIYGTHASGNQMPASYKVDRFGAEVGADVLVTPPSWFELHLAMSVALTGITGSGHYCTNADGFGVDCPTDGSVTNMVDANGSGAFVTGTFGAYLDLFRHGESFFHGGRIGALIGGGMMPTFVGGLQRDATLYGSVGLSLSVAFGE